MSGKLWLVCSPAGDLDIIGAEDRDEALADGMTLYGNGDPDDWTVERVPEGMEDLDPKEVADKLGVEVPHGR